MRIVIIFLVFLSISLTVSARVASINEPGANALGLCQPGYTLTKGGSGCTSTNQGCYTVASGCCHKNKGCTCPKKPGESSQNTSIPISKLSQLNVNPENENFCTVILALKKYKLTGALEDIYADLISECTK